MAKKVGQLWQIIVKLADCYTPGTIIGLAPGCFDMLHPGHVHLLQEARKQCNVLVVATNTDRSITELKGPERPICSLDQRLSMLAALDCVDYILIFDTEAKLAEIFDKLEPDYVFKGAEYDTEDHKYSDELFNKHGIQAKFIETLENFSTTNLTGKLKVLC